jgi:hypothetical protein
MGWLLGKPSFVIAARLADGSRADVSNTLDHGFRRSSAAGRRWSYGRIDIRSDDVLFIDGEQPVYTPPQTEVPNLEAELAHDAPFLAAIKDDLFADAVYAVLANRVFMKGLVRWECGDRQAAHLVADLRGLGESYQDYFCRVRLKEPYPDDRLDTEQRLQAQIEELSRIVLSLPASEGPLEELVPRPPPNSVVLVTGVRALHAWKREALEQARQTLAEFQARPVSAILETLQLHLRRLGWRSQNEQDRQRLFQKSRLVLDDAEELEKRPQGLRGEWTQALTREQHPNQTVIHSMPSDLSQRLYGLAFTGRITREEFDSIVIRLTEE